MTPHEDTSPIPEDPIVAEVRAIREAIFAECGYDLHTYFERARERTEQLRREGWVVLDPPPARPAADRDAA